MTDQTPSRSSITTHILDSTTGLPAHNIHAILQLMSVSSASSILEAKVVLDPPIPFAGVTSEDGRINSWEPQSVSGAEPPVSFQELWARHERSRTIWALKLDCLRYWGENNTFYPEVEIKFVVKQGGHYHVPVLLGPWGYTTYRGS